MNVEKKRFYVERVTLFIIIYKYIVSIFERSLLPSLQVFMTPTDITPCQECPLMNHIYHYFISIHCGFLNNLLLTIQAVVVLELASSTFAYYRHPAATAPRRRLVLVARPLLRVTKTAIKTTMILIT